MLGRQESSDDGLIEAVLQAPAQVPLPQGHQSELLTFWFADVRGYTKFTQERGDEAAAKLTGKFASIVRELVPDYDGTVVELRGDEVLCVFRSPRQSVRLAVAMQKRFVAETAVDAELPMTVGIGIDVGEVVHGADGYRGGALNLAARLCAQAKAGEILASTELAHLARTIDGVRYVTLDSVILKGLSTPVRPVRVVPEGEDPAQQIARLTASRRLATPPPRWARWLPGQVAQRPLAALGIAVGLVAAIIIVAVVVSSRGGHSLGGLGEHSVGIVDPGDGRLLAETGVDSGPAAATSGFGSVWVANADADSVTRLSIATHQALRTISVGVTPSAVAAGDGAVWVANSASGTVTRIDPTSDQTETIPVGSAPAGVVVASGSVWVTNSGDGTISRIDPTLDQVVETLDVGDAPTGIAAGRDLWVVNSESNSVSRIDGSNGHYAVTDTVNVGHDPRDVVVDVTGVWVSNNLDGTISRLAPDGSSVSATVRVGGQPDQLVTQGGTLWVGTGTAQSIVGVDTATAQIKRTTHLGVIPGALAFAGHRLWVGGTISPLRHDGGTLQLTGPDPGGPLDPTYAPGPESLWLLTSSYDHLVGFRQAGGAAGTTLVPDLATVLPEPTQDGSTYQFQLRAGIRWSTGQPLTVFDVRRGIERAVASGLSPSLAATIAGARGCTVNRCTISGITVDPSAGTVTFSLAHPNVRFLDQLATYGPAVPATTPLGASKAFIPATGPYQVSTYTPEKLIVLSRNPFFHEWSPAAQPGGYPNRIEWRITAGTDNGPGVQAVAASNADWAEARGTQPISVLQARFGSLLHVTPTETTHGVALNTQLPPFNDVRVRRALAFAVDRQAVANDWFTPAQVTCQALPPDFPGHRPFCPYTLRANTSGTWNAPDLHTALQLVEQSGTKGMDVTVDSPPRPSPGIRDVVSALAALGYRARLSVFHGPTPSYFTYTLDSRHRVQAAFYGLVADNPDPGEFFDPQFTCAGFVPANGVANANPSNFCDPVFDRLVRQAQSAESTSAAAANGLWAHADRELVDSAPWIPLVTPTWVDVVSQRVHNYQRNPLLGVLFDQMWLR